MSSRGLRAEESSLTAPQQSADGIVGPAQARLVRHPKADRRGNREAEPQRDGAEGLNGGEEESPDVERWDRIRRGVRPLTSGMNSRLARRDMRLRLG